MSEAVRVVELFAGIGGCAAALGGLATSSALGANQVVAAVDIHTAAMQVYRSNFAHPTLVKSIESLSVADARRWEADLWWMSPPCQPFTRRGLQRDDRDPRSRALLHLVDLIERVQPPMIALENVLPFENSACDHRLSRVLARHGYEKLTWRLCPSQWGIPNRRPRFYLAASRVGWRSDSPSSTRGFSLAEVLLVDPPDELGVDAALAAQYAGALHCVRANDPTAVTACFTRAYGRSPVRSGSYLVTDGGLRRFAPEEILRLLGFPAEFGLPGDWEPRRAWPLVGNSLSVPAVRAVLGHLVELPGTS